jgi:hypothetical protein
MPGGGSTYRRGGRQKGTPNKQSIPAIKAAIIRANGPELDSLSLGRLAAYTVLEEMNKLKAAEEYDPEVLVDWAVKLARIIDSYIGYEHPRVSPIERDDRFVEAQHGTAGRSQAVGSHCLGRQHHNNRSGSRAVAKEAKKMKYGRARHGTVAGGDLRRAAAAPGRLDHRFHEGR